MEGFDPVAWGASPDELAAFEERFELGGVLGVGGAGRVLAARDRESGRDVALKFFVAQDAEMAERFLREARLMRDLAHPHVLTVHETRSLGDVPYMVCERLPGGSLREYMKKTGRLAGPEAVRYALDVLSGLQALHTTGIVHRDLKPANVLLTIDGRAKIADLGVAKVWGSADVLTNDGLILGTPAYMAPEQLRGEAPGVSSDLYAVGVMLFEMMAARLPHDAASLTALVRLQRDDVAREVRTLAGSVHEGLLSVCERLLAPRPADRPATADDAAHRLRRVARMAGWFVAGVPGCDSSVGSGPGLHGSGTPERPRRTTARAVALTSGLHTRSGAALALKSSPAARRPTSRRPALPSMRSFRARSGKIVLPTVKASLSGAVAALDRRALCGLAALVMLALLSVRYVLAS